MAVGISWSNSISVGSIINYNFPKEIYDKLNAINGRHCPENYTGYCTNNRGGYNGSHRGGHCDHSSSNYRCGTYFGPSNGGNGNCWDWD